MYQHKALVVLIDDLRDFKPEVINPDTTVVTLRSSKEALEWLESWKNKTNPEGYQPIDMLWLDHDLGMTPEGDIDTIAPVVYELMEMVETGKSRGIKLVYVHTSNPIGRDRMVDTLSKHYTTLALNAGEYFQAQ